MRVFDQPASACQLDVHVGLGQPAQQQSPILHSKRRNALHRESSVPDVDQSAFLPFDNQFWSAHFSSRTLPQAQLRAYDHHSLNGDLVAQ